MDRKRKVTGRQTAAAARVEDGMSSDDEDMEVPSAPLPAQRASTRRQTPRVDLSKLDASSLRRYRKHYKLGEAAPGSSKEELMPAVARHFQHHVVDESDTLVNFALALKKASLQNGVSGLGLPVATKKPRGAAAANGKGKLR